MMSYESVRHDMGLYPVEDHDFSDVDGLFPKLKQPYTCDSLDLNENDYSSRRRYNWPFDDKIKSIK